MNRPSTRFRPFVATLVATALFAAGSGIAIAAARASRLAEPLRLIASFVERLDLTAGQRAQIRAVLQDHQDELASLAQREAATRLVLFQAIHQPDVNEPSVRLAHRAVAAADSDLAVERAAICAEIAPILSDGQKAEVAAFTERVRALVRTELDRNLGPRAGLGKLNLSEEQRAEIRAILDSHAAALETLTAAELDTRSALVAAIRTSPVDEAAIREASAAVADVDVELAVERARIFAEIEDTLTPEQREKLAKVQERLRQALEDRASLAFTIGTRLLG